MIERYIVKDLRRTCFLLLGILHRVLGSQKVLSRQSRPGLRESTTRKRAKQNTAPRQGREGRERDRDDRGE
jgi:hypothetical protein